MLFSLDITCFGVKYNPYQSLTQDRASTRGSFSIETNSIWRLNPLKKKFAGFPVDWSMRSKKLPVFAEDIKARSNSSLRQRPQGVLAGH
jgi:hypothetical protein